MECESVRMFLVKAGLHHLNMIIVLNLLLVLKLLTLNKCTNILKQLSSGQPSIPQKSRQTPTHW